MEYQTPMRIEVNLTIENDWDCIVEPANFTLVVQFEKIVEQEITVTVNAPLGVEDQTEHTVRITGTWSYITGVPGGGELQPVTLNLLAQNFTVEPNGNGDGDDDDDSSDSDSGFLPGFESTGILVAIVIVVLIFTIKSRKRAF
jgi:hypothetical protein